MESNAARAVSSGCRGGSAAGLFPMLNPLGLPRGGHGEWAEWLGGQRGVAFHKAAPSKLVAPILEERASPASSSPSATPSPRLWFLEPSRSLVTGHRAARTAWVLPATTVFCPPPEMLPVAPSRPRPRCRHPLLMQRAGSPPRSVPPPPRIQAPVATRLHGVSVPGTGGIRVTHSGGGDCPVHQDPMSGHPPTSSHCDNQTHLQTGCPLRNGSVPLGVGHFQDR